MAATVLLGSTLKFEGALTLQLQGDGPLHLLVVQCTSERNLRGMAQWHGDVAGLELSALVGAGRLAITIEQSGRAERYQGIVPLEGDSLAQSFEAYFRRSEQLPTRLWLTAGGSAAAGLMLQTLPGETDDSGDPDAWNRFTMLADTVTPGELRDLAAQDLLHRLYHEEDVRLFESAPVAFRCRCSRERIADMLRRLGHDEVRSIVADEGEVRVACEFCGREYRFDSVDTQALFADGSGLPGSSTRH
jgi:molecular chaperone Hsp33